MSLVLQVFCALIALSSTAYAQYPVVKPTLVIVDDGCPMGYMKSKGGACFESPGALIPIPELDGSCPLHYFEVDGKCHRSIEAHDKCPPGFTRRRGICRPTVNPCGRGYDYELGHCVPIEEN